ncbi:hypothetical protein OPT61_g2790 [Boeremia exigua]|uniref:Uncharacterized protein n=1 Tax=Boeremia exigua TaxID=749465 RepID=A0ACC2IK76_9PLEO|nr:hypothetical protein OPT61_g2790 [Boeremia exigua]
MDLRNPINTLSTMHEGGDYIFDNDEQLPYVLLANLGFGHSGNVEKVQDRHTSMIFARKTIPMPPGRARAEKERIFNNEIAVIRRLHTHHHIVRVFATYMTSNHFGLILQPVADGGDLAKYLVDYWSRLDDKEPTYSEDTELEALRCVLKQAFGCLASGLAFIHAQRIRHKDIKPQNILVHEGSVVITDFGYSLDTSQFSTSATDGTPNFLTKRYAAPEVLDNESRNSSSDIWSLGCVFIEILSALTLAFKVDHDTFFSGTIEELHKILREIKSSECSPIPETIMKMTSLTATHRPKSQEIAAQLTKHTQYCCNSCHKSQPLVERTISDTGNNNVAKITTAIDLGLQESFPTSKVQPEGPQRTNTARYAGEGTWIWSDPHRDYYMMGYDANGQVIYHWAKQLSTQPQTSRMQPTVSDGNHPQGDGLIKPADPGEEQF